MRKTKYSFIRDWLEGFSSIHDNGPQCDLHREAVKAIVDYAESGDEHRGIVGHNLGHVLACLGTEFQMEPLSPSDNILGILGRWEGWSRAGNLTSLLKWWFCCTYSWIAGQPLPATPEFFSQEIGSCVKNPIFHVLSGRIGRFFRSVVRKLHRELVSRRREGPLKRRSLSKALTLRFLARGTCKVSKEEIDRALEKHRIALTEVDGFSVSCSTQDVAIQRLKQEVIRTSREVFGKAKFSHRAKPLFPSRKGHTGSSARSGGAASKVLCCFDSCASRTFEGVGYSTGLGLQPITPLTEDSQERFASAVFRILVKERQGPEPLLAKPVAIPEPCKVRVVTKGPEFTYWYLRDLQQFLWRTLKKHPCFSLVGEPITEEYLALRMKGVPLGSKFCSGDYVDSTNCIRADLSKICAETISDCIGLSDFDRDMFVEALVGHTLQYPSGSRCKQTNGQLMGSPVSFPVLCIINAAICRCSMECSDREFTDSLPTWAEVDAKTYISLRDAPLAVNGDDCVFGMKSDDIFQRWERIAAFAGLKSSMGKTYVSADFLQMNSTTYRIIPYKRVGDGPDALWGSTPHWFETVPYVNLGFCRPFDPKGGRERTYRDLPGLARKFIEGFPLERADAMMTTFLRSHAGLLSSIPEGMSYWLPVHLGGLGLPVTRELSLDQFSDLQLNFAEFLLHHEEEVPSFPSEEREVPCWVRTGERYASSLRQRQKEDLPSDPWNNERVILEDEQFIYWMSDADPSGVVVPSSRGNYSRLRRKFSRSCVWGNSHSPLATFLGSPSPVMRMPRGTSALLESVGYHPRGLYWRIASLVDRRPYQPPSSEGSSLVKGRPYYHEGWIFEIFEDHLVVRKDDPTWKRLRFPGRVGVDVSHYDYGRNDGLTGLVGVEQSFLL